MYNLNLQKILVVKTKTIEFFPKLKYFNAVVEKSNKNEKGLSSLMGETFFFKYVKSKCFKNIFNL